MHRIICTDTFSIRFKVEDNSMPQCRGSNRINILCCHILPSLNQGTCLCCHCNTDRCTRRSTVLEQGFTFTGSINDLDDPSCQIFRYRNMAHIILQGLNCVLVQYLSELFQWLGRSIPLKNLLFFLKTWIGDQNLEEETICLCFRQGIGTFLLDGVLGCKDEERTLKLERLCTNRHLLFLHRFQQRRLSLGRRTVDLICQDHVCKDGGF